MILIKLKASKAIGCINDDVPDEKEWHGPDWTGEFTACGLAHSWGGTDRQAQYKEGKFKSITCQICKQVIKHYKTLK